MAARDEADKPIELYWEPDRYYWGDSIAKEASRRAQHLKEQSSSVMEKGDEATKPIELYWEPDKYYWGDSVAKEASERVQRLKEHQGSEVSDRASKLPNVLLNIHVHEFEFEHGT